MNAWLIGGGIYAVALLFALALCRVASSVDEGDLEDVVYEPRPAARSSEHALQPRSRQLTSS